MVWLKNHHCLHNMKLTGKTVSANTDIAKKFKELSGIMAKGGYSTKVFSVYENGLY